MSARRYATQSGRRGSLAAPITGLTLASLLAGCHPRPAQTPAQREHAMCVWNLQRIGISSVIYAQEHHDRMLPAQNGMQASLLLEPYLRGKNVTFSCPQTAKPYLFNVQLSQRTRASIRLRASTPVFKDAAPHEDGTVTVAFLDGHVKRIPAAEADALGGVFR